ncbi:hypothetical protein ARMGADRAFT_1038930 [Armillaria gallica]|uniref:Uncharacterized protein n=1 Tax=Armillaria gallica TaxID=47427 RepID=A0A2H3CZ38_ARMGA|nr:hypothetical protein ARMGADRAFT_1038930 [Armillaria gallica]
MIFRGVHQAGISSFGISGTGVIGISMSSLNVGIDKSFTDTVGFGEVGVISITTSGLIAGINGIVTLRVSEVILLGARMHGLNVGIDETITGTKLEEVALSPLLAELVLEVSMLLSSAGVRGSIKGGILAIVGSAGARGGFVHAAIVIAGGCLPQ